jgi:hypothetical protein
MYNSVVHVTPFLIQRDHIRRLEDLGWAEISERGRLDRLN